MYFLKNCPKKIGNNNKKKILDYKLVQCSDGH